ncbi:hypothetical protein Q5P01_002237 [Channa striata]|uniref:Immunoglobulin V-set domain-containing protein n=1 Tax=Channa striata TaxID=64152 RepID=A0AA88NTZ7_CHASR|nr:hypothetical protein Q5P01_002237 [Channa striata]
MKNLVIIASLLLCISNRISVSGSETLDTVEVHSGEDVTLLCPNISGTPTQTEWFTLVNGTKPRCISSICKIRKIHKAGTEQPMQEKKKNLDFDPNPGVLRFLPQTMRSRKHGQETEVETLVIYTAIG